MPIRRSCRAMCSFHSAHTHGSPFSRRLFRSRSIRRRLRLLARCQYAAAAVLCARFTPRIRTAHPFSRPIQPPFASHFFIRKSHEQKAPHFRRFELHLSRFLCLSPHVQQRRIPHQCTPFLHVDALVGHSSRQSRLHCASARKKRSQIPTRALSRIQRPAHATARRTRHAIPMV